MSTYSSSSINFRELAGKSRRESWPFIRVRKVASLTL
jgi:hypothetical protein